jgi:hypothetical protein
MKTTSAFSVAENEAPSYTDLASQTIPARCQTRLADLKADLVSRLTSEFPEVQSQLVRQAVIEADALASLTIVPYLLLPTLAEEKVLGLSNWTIHQQAITGHSGLAFAA